MNRSAIERAGETVLVEGLASEHHSRGALEEWGLAAALLPTLFEGRPRVQLLVRHHPIALTTLRLAPTKTCNGGVIDPGDLLSPVKVSLPRQRKVTSQAFAQMGSIESIGCVSVRRKTSSIECAKTAIAVVGHVGHNQMTMQVRIATSRDAVGKSRSDRSIDRQGSHLTRVGFSPGNRKSSILEIANNGINGIMMRMNNRPRHLMVGRSEQNAHALWGCDNEIKCCALTSWKSGQGGSGGLAGKNSIKGLQLN
jgi:hypothetical protein